MCKLILDSLDSQTPLMGSLSELSVADVLQMLCMSRKTTAVRVMEGKNAGMIYIEEGEVVHAVWNKSVGESALFEMLRETEGLFCSLPSPPNVARTIQRSWQHLLLEGMQLIDEGAMNNADVDSTTDETEGLIEATSHQGAFEAGDTLMEAARLIDLGFLALRKGDLRRARDNWEQAAWLEPENRTIRLNLRRLDQIEARKKNE
jgi:hypothetical protein